MSKNFARLLATLIPILLLVSGASPAFAAIQHYGQPRLDDAYMPVILTPAAQTSAFQLCQIEMLPDMLVWANINKLMNVEGNTMIASPGYHYCYIGISCRAAVPGDDTQPDAGRDQTPQDDKYFRQALAWAGLSPAQKTAAINQIYGGPAVTATNTPVPPALGEWSKDPPQYPGGDYAAALLILTTAGYYKNTTDNKLYKPNGVEVRDQFEVLSPSAAPTSVAFCQKWVDQWNDFFDNFVGVVNVNFWNNPIPSATITQRVWLWRNFDLYFLCWGLGRYPDYLYDFFHSTMEGVDGNNAMGIMDPALDAVLEDLKFGTSKPLKLQACWDAQDMLVLDLVPCVYLYSRTYYTAFKNYMFYTAQPLWLTNGINMAGQGADNGWTWGLLHWNIQPVGGSLKYCLTGNILELHPGWAQWAYEWDILNHVNDGLLGLDPNLVSDLSWIACYWNTEPFAWEPLNVDGQKVTFKIRDDVVWHDWHPLDIYDLQFAFDFVRNFPRYEGTWQYILWSQVVDPCTIDVYLNTTSQFIYSDLAGIALLFPEHIYGPTGWLATHAYDPVNAEVWTIPYLVGDARKALVGCGPYVFDYWDEGIQQAHLVSFGRYVTEYPRTNIPLVLPRPILDVRGGVDRYFADGPILANLYHPQRVNDCVPFDYYMVLVNTGSKDTITGELVPAVIDYIDMTIDGQVVFTIPGPIVLNPFTNVTLGPFEAHFDKGPHILDCHIYAYGELYEEYESPVWVTKRQDVTLDFYVGIDDIFAAAAAFGSEPLGTGAGRWDERCDMNDDYYVGIDDIFSIAVLFGWDA